MWVDRAPVRGLTTGVAARVSVFELADDPEVERVTVRNDGTRPALLLEGELVEGGLQTRALRYDLIVAAGASVTASVACVEQGRWHGGAEHRRRARRTTPSVQRALRTDAETQARVRAEVDRHQQRAGATASASLTDHLDRLALDRAIAVRPCCTRWLSPSPGGGHAVSLPLRSSCRCSSLASMPGRLVLSGPNPRPSRRGE